MPYTLLTDEELFAMVRDQNDEQAFRALFKRYDKRVYAYCLRALGSHDDAQDVFQTIQLTVYTSERRLRMVRSPLGCLRLHETSV